MENAANKKLQTNRLNGYYVEVQNNLGNSIRIIIQEKQSGKIFEANSTHNQLSEVAKALFPSIDELYEHIQQCIKNETDLLKVMEDGSLEIGEVYKKSIRKVIIPTVQREQTPLQRIERENYRQSKRIDQLTEEVRNQKQQLNEQLRRVKEQVLNRVDQSKREGQTSAQQILDGIQAEWQNKLAELEKKSSAAMEQTKSDCERVQREQQQRLDRVNEEIRRLNETLASKESLQAMRENFGKFSSKAEVNENRQVALQDKQDSIQRELQKHVTILQSQFPLIYAKRVSFVVDTSLEAFKKHWKIDEASKIIEKTTDCYSQVVSKNELPKTGKYYFEVRCINKQYPYFGIVTNSSRDKEYVSSEQDQFIRLQPVYSRIIQNGKQLQKVKCTINNGDLVSIFVDKQKAQIRWFVNHHSIASAKLAECFQTKPIYALLVQYYAGKKYQCIE